MAHQRKYGHIVPNTTISANIKGAYFLNANQFPIYDSACWSLGKKFFKWVYYEYEQNQDTLVEMFNGKLKSLQGTQKGASFFVNNYECVILECPIRHIKRNKYLKCRKLIAYSSKK